MLSQAITIIILIMGSELDLDALPMVFGLLARLS